MSKLPIVIIGVQSPTDGHLFHVVETLDDPGFFQISVSVQPGNSGGALVDERGNVVGVVAAKLKTPSSGDKKFEEVVKDAEQAAVLVLVY